MNILYNYNENENGHRGSFQSLGSFAFYRSNEDDDDDRVHPDFNIAFPQQNGLSRFVICSATVHILYMQ
jgi:hypothetical protein